jgi:hypothetical protein
MPFAELFVPKGTPHARWAARFGVASAVVSVLSISTLVARGSLVLLIAVGRFSALAYVIAVGFMLRQAEEPDPTRTLRGGDDDLVATPVGARGG